jgi:hypothetical protein
VFTARYALSPYIKQVCFVFKGLKCHNHEQENCVYCCYVAIVSEGAKTRWISTSTYHNL